MDFAPSAAIAFANIHEHARLALEALWLNRRAFQKSARRLCENFKSRSILRVMRNSRLCLNEPDLIRCPVSPAGPAPLALVAERGVCSRLKSQERRHGKDVPKTLQRPYDKSLIQLSQELVKPSRELLNATKPLVGRRPHWPAGRDQGQSRPS